MENLIKINTRESGIFVFIGGFTFGILLASFFSVPIFISLFVLLVALAILVTEKIYKKFISKEAILLTVLLFSIGVGFLRYDYKNQRKIDQNFEAQTGQRISIDGFVVDEPERKDNVTRLIVLPNQIHEKILVSTDIYNHSNYGDVIRVTGKLQKPGIIKGDDGRNFNYAAYLSKDDIYYTISFAQVEIISSGNGNILKTGLYKIKNKFISKIRELFSEPEASLLAGLILAGKESLPKNILEEFQRAGIVHIVVLSGYNITIVAEFFLKIFSFFSLRIAALSAGGSIILFTLMTGAEATVVRAGLMALILLTGKIIGRGYSAPRALLVAGFLMLLENPKILAFDTSFKLSFLATLALMFAVPIVNNYMNWVTENGGLRSIVSTTIGTQVVVLPYILYTMGNFSIVSLLSNILTLIIIPITMLIGFVAALLGFASNFIALPFAFVAHALLYWILFVGERLGNLSWGSLDIKAFPAWVVLIWYGAYIGIYWYLKNRNTTQSRVLIDKP